MIIKLIFALLKKYVPIPPDDYAQMLNEAEDWYAKMRFDKEYLESDKVTQADKIKAKIRSFCEQWYIKVAFSLGYLWLLTKIPSWLNPDKKEVKNDEDDF